MKKLFLLAVIMSTAIMGCATVTVNMSAPANTTVSSPVRVTASASTTTSSISGWRIYVDGNSAYIGAATSTISPAITMTPGTHNIVVRAWAGDGSYGSQQRTVAVSAATTNQVSVNLSSPANSTASPVHVAATASTTQSSITGWQVYVDGKSAYVGGATNSIAANVSMAAGTHNVVVRAWNGNGAYGDQSRNVTVTAASAGVTPPPQVSGYHLAFSDDFNSLSISPNGTGSYTWYNPGQYWGPAAPYSNIFASNSALTLNWTRGQSPPDTSIATSAKDGSHYKAWRYGYYETRMRWDVTTGAWPAFWLMPVQAFTNPGAQLGEIDIFEGQGAEPRTYYGTIHNWQNHQDIYNNQGSNVATLPSGTDLSQYHTYGLLWVPGTVTWYFDNQPLFSARTPAAWDQEDFYIILSAQEGANWSPGNLSGVTASKIGVNFDWVRVWQQ